MIFHFQEETIRKKHGKFWEEMEHYCMKYGVINLTKIVILIHLISYNVNFKLQHELYGFGPADKVTEFYGIH